MTPASSPARRALPFKLMTVLLSLALGATAVAAWLLRERAQRYHQLVAVSWGQSDPNGPPALYGAYVWLAGSAPNLRVTLSLYIDRPTFMASYQFQDRDLGPAASAEEAVAHFGAISWAPEGLRIGSGARSVLIPAAELAQHR